ncbi:hypothetical protein ACN3XK_09135 [Actinomadura welshii]
MAAMTGVLVLLVLVFWSAAAQPWVIARIWGPVIRLAGDRTARAALLSALAYVAGVVLLGVLTAGTHLLFGESPTRVAALVLASAYAPVALAPIPDRDALYRNIRRELMKAGATHGQARACAWTTGPLGFVGMVAVGGAVLCAALA